MPCDSIITNTVAFEVAVKNPELLGRAVAAEFGTQLQTGAGYIGYEFVVDGWRISLGPDGIARSRAPQQRLGQQMDRLKQAYSREAVKEAARKAGFAVRQQGDTINRMVAERRSA